MCRRVVFILLEFTPLCAGISVMFIGYKIINMLFFFESI